MSWMLSVFYLLLVLATLLLQAVAGMVATEFMTTSNLWLTPVQGLVGATLGVFFVSRGLESARQ